MGDPVTTAMLIGTIVSAAGTAYAGYQSFETAKFNEKVADQNALAAQRKASYDESIHRERVRQLLSTQRARFGAAGVDISSGSPLLVMEETAAQGELDALAIRAGGDVAATQARSEGMLRARSARARGMENLSNAGSTLLTGYGRYKRYGKGAQ